MILYLTYWALFMVANEHTPDDIRDPQKEIAFPESVVSLFKGELGVPPDGFPKDFESKVLRGRKPLSGARARTWQRLILCLFALKSRKQSAVQSVM